MNKLDQPFLRNQVFDMINYGGACRGEQIYAGGFTPLPGEEGPTWLTELYHSLLLSNIHATFYLSSKQCNYLMRSE